MIGVAMLKLPKMAPHTAAKHLLLKRYLDRWFPIIGKYHKSINYIDGFAGPGEYQGGELGSPQMAIEAAMAHVAKGTLGSNVQIHFSFVESDMDSARNLEKKLSTLKCPSSFSIEVTSGRFAETIGLELDRLEREKQSPSPIFAFVDPFGFSGIPLELMSRILHYPKCEVFVNIMVEYIKRFLEHPNDQVVAHFPQTFGTDDVLKIPQQMGHREAAILSLYRSQLTKLAKYVGRFDMHGKRDQKTYSLFFG